jgi:hypothetical protein
VVAFFCVVGLIIKEIGYYMAITNVATCPSVYVQYRIYFQNGSAMVSLNSVLVELLALQLGEYPGSAEAKMTVQRWLGASVRNRYGHLLGKNDPVEEWARACVLDAVIVGKGL